MNTSDVVGAIAGISILANLGLYTVNSSKAKDIEKLKVEVKLCQVNADLLYKTIQLQNNEIEKYIFDLNASEERWKNRTSSEVVVTKWRTKYIDRNITVEKECNEILNVIDTFGF